MQLNKSSVFNPGGAAMHYQLMYSWDIFDTMVSVLCLAVRSRIIMAVFLMNVHCLFRISGFNFIWAFICLVSHEWCYLTSLFYWLLYDSWGDTCILGTVNWLILFGCVYFMIELCFGTSWSCSSCQSHVRWSHMVPLQITPWSARKHTKKLLVWH